MNIETKQDEQPLKTHEHAAESMPVLQYLSFTAKTIDGRAWIGVCIATMICLTLFLVVPTIIPLRDIGNPAKAITLLGFTPAITFLVMVVLRQLPASDGMVAATVRALFCVATFLILNF